MIVDQDTATGMLLTGIGHVDIRRRSNFLIVDDSELSKVIEALKKFVVDIWRIGMWITEKAVVFAETPLPTIEDTFKQFTTREDIAVLMINQSIANTIRHLLDAYTKPVPAIIEVPSKDQPYDPTQDSILARVKFMFGEG